MDLEAISSIPEPAHWAFDTDGTARLPVDEVVAVYSMMTYLTEQLAACHAATKKAN